MAEARPGERPATAPGSPLSGRRVAEVLATSTGGVGTHVRTLLPAVAAAGAQVAVCGPAATEQLFSFTTAGAVFRAVEISAGLAPAADARAVLALRRATTDADLVHAHGLRAGLVAYAATRRGPRARRRSALVLTLHNALPEGVGLRRRVLEVAERAAIRGADVVLTASDDLAENARRLGADDVRSAPVSAPPLPPPVRDRAQVRAELGLADGRPLVLAVGRLHPQKGYDVLLDAAGRWGRDPRLPVPPLVAIAGDGPLQGELAGRIAAEGLPVRLLGRRTDVADLLAAADLCVLPSRWEARSLTAQEALRSGTPLVATRTGGLPGLVGEAAVLVPVGDAAALAEAVAAVLADPADARRLAEAGRRQAGTWPDEAATAAHLVALYRELLGPAGGGSR